MKRIISLLGLLVLCLTLSTCGGTVRAISGDYADDYVIRDIRPLSGVSGETVQFEMAVCENAGAVHLEESTMGDEDYPQVIWNFGTGAEPNISYDLEPEVVLRDGIRSPYECSVTVRYGCLTDEQITSNFTLNVAPLDILAVSPLTGVGGASATFSVVLSSGVGTEYAWDFGGACSPNGSNVENPTVQFVETGGTFNCRLLVSNAFEIAEFPFVLQVAPDPTD